jgi:hypothetical protein
LLVRQYPGISGNVLKVLPDVWHTDPKGHGRQATSSSLFMASKEPSTHLQSDLWAEPGSELANSGHFWQALA